MIEKNSNLELQGRLLFFCNTITQGLTLNPKGHFNCKVDLIMLSSTPKSSELVAYNFYIPQNWRNTFAIICWIQMKRWKRHLGPCWRKLFCYGFKNIVHCWQNDYVEKYSKYWQQETLFQGLFSCFIYPSIPIETKVM